MFSCDVNGDTRTCGMISLHAPGCRVCSGLYFMLTVGYILYAMEGRTMAVRSLDG